MMRGVAILGSTGSIGRSALAVLGRHADRFRVVALAAYQNAPELRAQVDRFQPDLAVLVSGAAETGWQAGREGLMEAATHPDVDIVINAVVGAAGLEATLAALQAGKRLALANKESLVAGGPLVLRALGSGRGELIPVDSEHSAILQCLTGSNQNRVKRLILTASGGPFRQLDETALSTVTPAQALRHPTWDMGAKVTIDSATLANKALEVIEAHFLFGLDYNAIEAVVHPQSIIHSMVEFVDGSVLAQLGFPTMEMPILYALTHPDRLADTGTRAFDPVLARSLTFEPVDPARFRAYSLGLEAGRTGGTMPAVFNAANEVAVAGFLAGNLPFPGIAQVIEMALEAHRPMEVDCLETVLEADRETRVLAHEALNQRC
ncbi:MAG TPA: 1-deoxy-D-xylulose-5-phosphate reductoisomerase [Longimicrobiales bacterium]|nr:1-deoxy-D-xylulose-5-phosphate reductoisomerase [Longimicrobiales bacterium]